MLDRGPLPLSNVERPADGSAVGPILGMHPNLFFPKSQGGKKLSSKEIWWLALIVDALKSHSSKAGFTVDYRI